MANFTGTTGNDTQTGTGAGDTFDYSQGGRDTLTAKGGDDIFLMGGALNGADVIDGGTGNDEVVLDGNYNIVFTATTVVNVETLTLTGGHTYDLTLDDATVGGVGKALTVDGSLLGQADFLEFHGEAETAAAFTVTAGRSNDSLFGGSGADFLYGGPGGDTLIGNSNTDHLYGGKGNDSLAGGEGSDFGEGGKGVDVMAGDIGDDQLWGGGGGDILFGDDGFDVLDGQAGQDLIVGGDTADRFVFAAVADSTGAKCDWVQDFNTNIDTIHIPLGPLAIDAVIASGALSLATFDTDLAAAVNGTTLGALNAVVFAPDAGELAGTIYVVMDQNNTAGYQAGADLVVQMTGGSGLVEGGLNLGNFI